MRPSSPASVAAAPSSTKSPPQQQIHHALSNYIATVQREDFLPRLNDELYTCAASAYVESDGIENYYAIRPELREYTLGVEMDRDVDYTLIQEDGTSLTDKQAIRSYFASDEGSDEKRALLVRSANQSLLADALVALTGLATPEQEPTTPHGKPKLGLILSDPQLCMAASVDKCHYIIDLRKLRVRAICVLAISVPTDDSRLVLGRAMLQANFRPGKRNPLQYAVHMLQAYYWPQSRALYDASVSLAKDQMLASKHEQEYNKSGRQTKKIFQTFSQNLGSMLALSKSGDGSYRRSVTY